MNTIMKIFCFFAVYMVLSTGCDDRLGKGVKLKDIMTDGQVRINLGEKGKARAYPIPWNCTDYAFKWESANPSVVTVDDYGNLTSVDVGNTVVYVSQENIKKEIPVEVYEIALSEKLTKLGAKGFWQFQDPNNLFKATIGKDLVPFGSGYMQTTGPNNRTKAIVIPCSEKVDGMWQFNYLFCDHGLAANGGGARVNEYSIVIDCTFPGGPTCVGGNFSGNIWDGGNWTNGHYYSLFQTDLFNTSDAHFFWRPGGDFGVRSHYTKLNRIFVKNTWYRFIISVKLGKDIVYYMNSTKYESSALGDIDSSRSWDLNGLLFFADDDGEDGQGSPLIVSSLAIFDRVLTIDDVIAIGPLFLQK